MEKDKYRIIKINKEALYEFIYEMFVTNQEDYLDINPIEVCNTFKVDFKNGQFIFMAYKSEDENGEIIQLPEEIDLQALKGKMEATTTSMFKKDRYVELSLDEIIKLQES